ncbi:amino acid ABC transporter permease [Actinoplanes sp. OR16]|uniref:amino acid ABC transporter permease n=1 Tax=Actinoplanes sp. OR16 TaxID=946334 RepID=UPI000F6DCFF1|nr:amino acid ABC transporter permease [Actinoplanes sp. OR16]BBH68719.1 amino acid ABC transporter permease [Actinoplanes sp. OR16]
MTFYPVRRPRAWGQIIQAAVVVAAVPVVIIPFVNSGVFDLATVGEYLFGPAILTAVWGTLSLATLSTALALVLGTGVALLRISANPVLRAAAGFYVFVFRGTPMLVQLLIWFYAVPRIIGHVGLYIPGIDLVLIEYQPASNFFTPFVAGLFALTLAEAGYMAEVVRSGIQGVDGGQRDAARALGVPSGKIMRQIVLVQAFRIVLPAIANQYILMIKNTSLAYAIGYSEILLSVSRVYYTNFKYLELLLVAAFWYLLLTAVITVGQHFIERRFPPR